ncbi:dihydropteroate synthase [Actinomycetota bacterium]|nr:dihydropteroate synthase [Actinomycetota bacterium]
MTVMQIMGILNVTPDSFSDGGQHLKDPVADALELIAQGATIVDIGGQSTRPGCELATLEEELERVVPTIEGIRAVNQDILISVDTTRSIVAKQAILAGANIINDVSGGVEDPKILRVVANHPEVKYILMHSEGLGSAMRTLDLSNSGGDIVQYVLMWLKDQLQVVKAAGITDAQIIVDPGPGFSKATLAMNYPLIAKLEEFKALGYPVLAAFSRKRFLQSQFDTTPTNTDVATAALSLLSAQKGAWGVRVHNVPATMQALGVLKEFNDESAI